MIRERKKINHKGTKAQRGEGTIAYM